MSRDHIKQPPSKTSTTPRNRSSSKPVFSTSVIDRPLVHNSQHIDDHSRRSSIDTNERRHLRFDECSLQMTNDPNSSFYRRLSQTLEKRNSLQTPSAEEVEKFKLFEQYGPELVEFLKDKDGHIKAKFDKVFIT